MKKVLWLVGMAVSFVALCADLSPAQSAPANLTFAVNDQSDAIDNNLGDGVCLAANGKCTLRAAIQEANVQYAASPARCSRFPCPAATSSPVRASITSR